MLLSNTFVNKIIDIISHLIKENILTEVREAGMLSVQVDTTQDVTSTDQCAVVLRYVTYIVHEKLICVISYQSSTGQYFIQLLKDTLAKANIDIQNC